MISHIENNIDAKMKTYIENDSNIDYNHNHASRERVTQSPLASITSCK